MITIVATRRYIVPNSILAGFCPRPHWVSSLYSHPRSLSWPTHCRYFSPSNPCLWKCLWKSH